MNAPARLPPMPLDTARPLAIAVLAMGGQGGGVLVDWIVAVAESQGWVAQSTSVPGVAQRTGATIYYIETIARPVGAPELRPVLSLTPVPGQIDLVVGAELMEAGRAMQRGFVTPDRTTLIASTHRALAVGEKIVPGDGIAPPEKVVAAAEAAARRVIAFEMASVAEGAGSVISAVLLGAVAGSGELPFPREAYEEAIRQAGVGVAGSLRAFAAGFERAQAARTGALPAELPPTPAERKRYPALQPVGHPELDPLIARAAADVPPAAQRMVAAGLRKVVDFQDVAYGREYLDLLAGLLALDEREGGPARGHRLTAAAAKHLANAMAYDDVIRVADLKTRGSRFDRVRAEVAPKEADLLYTTEFMHPRMDEVCGTLPAGLGRWIEERPRVFRALDRVVNRGRRVRTGTIGWFLLLYGLGGAKRMRRGTLRHGREVAHRDAWLDRVREAAARDYDLAVELVENRRLVKGYSDTHGRSLSKFDRVMAAARLVEGRADAADWVRRLRQAALQDEKGAALDDAVRTVESFV